MTKLFLQNLEQEIRPTIQIGLSTVKIELLHHYVLGVVAMLQKHQTVLKH